MQCGNSVLLPLEPGMRARRLFVTFALVVVHVTSVWGQVSVDATGPIRGRTHEGTRGTGGGVGRKVPLNVAMEAKVSSPDAAGKTLVEFVLTNSGAKDITIPVSPNPGDLEPTDPRSAYTVMMLALRVSLSRKPGV